MFSSRLIKPNKPGGGTAASKEESREEMPNEASCTTPPPSPPQGPATVGEAIANPPLPNPRKPS